MKLKFINLLLASVLLVGSAQVFTSCKDNEADLYVNLKEDTITLKQKLEEDAKRLDDLKAALEKEIADRKADVQKLTDELAKTNKALEDFKKDADQKYATKAELEAAKKALEDKIDALNTKVEKNISDIITLQGDITRIDAAIATLQGQVNKNTEDIITINTAIGDIKVDITNINTQIADLYAKYNDLYGKYNDLEGRVSTLEGKVTVIESTLQQVQSDINTLNVKVADLEGQVSVLNDFMNEWKPVLPEIQKNAADALAKANKNAADIAALQALVATLQDQIELGNKQCEAAVAALQSQIDQLAAQVANCATLEELAYVTAELQEQAEAYYNASIGYTMYIAAGLRGYINDVNNKVTELEVTVGEINNEIARLEQAIIDGDAAVLQELTLLIANTKSDILEIVAGWIAAIEFPEFDPSSLQGQIDALKDDVAALQQYTELLQNGINMVNSRVDGLQQKVNEMDQKLNKVMGEVAELVDRVSGILIQATDNAVVGTFILPVGVSSNMLLAYASDDNIYDAEFPTVEGAYSYNGVVDGLGVAEGEVLPFKGNAVVNTDGGLMVRNEEGKGILGKVYMTINPANVNLEGKEFNLVTSAGRVLPVEIKPVPSDWELTEGYKRSAENGFYEAQAVIDLKDLSSVRFVLDPNFKHQVAAIVKDIKSLKNPSTIASLANALNEQLNGRIPALAMQCSWEELGKKQVVTSQYGLVAATFNPLSFSSLSVLEGKLPQIPNLPNIEGLVDRFENWFDKQTGKMHVQIWEPITVSGPEGTVTLTPVITKDMIDGIVTNLDDEYALDPNDPYYNPDWYGPDGSFHPDTNWSLYYYFYISSTGKYYPMPVQGSPQYTAKLLKVIFNAIGGNDQAVVDNINSYVDEINSAMAAYTESINSTIDEVVTSIKNSLFGKLDAAANRLSTYADRLQGIINRLNNVLADPCNYVQPIMLYKNNGHVGRLSTAKGIPSVFEASADKVGLTLVPTTYTLETVVPVYEKYVAVTKAWDANGNEVPAVAAAANKSGLYINEVVDATYHLLGIEFQKGYTYEILYQALDYQGLVSGDKYYVKVK